MNKREEETFKKFFEFLKRKELSFNTFDLEIIKKYKNYVINFNNYVNKCLNWLIIDLCKFINGFYLNNVGPEEKILNIYRNLPFKGSDINSYKNILEELHILPNSNSYEDFLKNLINYFQISVPNNFYFTLNIFIQSENLTFDSFDNFSKIKFIDKNKKEKLKEMEKLYESNSDFKKNDSDSDLIKELLKMNEKKEKNEEKKEKGYLGEFLIYKNLEKIFGINPYLAGKSIWVSKDIGDGFGYDILTYDSNGSEVLVEVKTVFDRTVMNMHDLFFIGKTELKKMKECLQNGNYCIARIFIDTVNYEMEVVLLKYDGLSRLISSNGDFEYELDKGENEKICKLKLRRNFSIPNID